MSMCRCLVGVGSAIVAPLSVVETSRCVLVPVEAEVSGKS
jgi:hypothetical protein